MVEQVVMPRTQNPTNSTLVRRSSVRGVKINLKENAALKVALGKQKRFKVRLFFAKCANGS